MWPMWVRLPCHRMFLMYKYLNVTIKTGLYIKIWTHVYIDILFNYLINMSWWRHQMETFPRYWPFVWGIHRWPVNSPQKGQWRGALMFSLICTVTNSWANNGDAGDLRRHRAHYDVILMLWDITWRQSPVCHQRFSGMIRKYKNLLF